MAKLTLTDITQLASNESSAVNEINANGALIEAALENTLSRDGTVPNAMEADLDLNSNDILNGGTISATSLILGATVFTETAAVAGGPVEIAETTVSGNPSEIIYDVAGYDMVDITFNSLTPSASTSIRAELGTNVSTFDATYQRGFLSNTLNDVSSADTFMFITAGSTTHFAQIKLRNLASATFASTLESIAHSEGVASSGILQNYYNEVNEVNTHIRLFPGTGTLSSGFIRVTGFRSVV